MLARILQYCIFTKQQAVFDFMLKERIHVYKIFTKISKKIIEVVSIIQFAQLNYLYRQSECCQFVRERRAVA